ncbi:MAG: proteasome subunit alpha, partial [Actinomycetota bacterium]|nr:proteasome subunit alpha [Actinomycetota bacterium]
REDVKAKDIANAYSQALSGIFTQQMKPYEVEILVGEAGEEPGENEIYHVLFDGSVTDEQGFVGVGGRSDELTEALRGSYTEGLDLAAAVHTAVNALSSVEGTEVVADQLEAGVLDRTRPSRRKFRRLSDAEVLEILPSG